MLRRQGSVQPLTPPTSTSTYDFWWPFPPDDIPTSTTSMIAAPSDLPPILISIIPSPPSLTQSTQNLSTEPSTAHISTDSNASKISSSSSSSTNPSSSAGSSTELNASGSRFKFIDLVPAFAVVGLFLLGLGLWMLYGCCTRKPRVRVDEGELVSGPPYVGIGESDARGDVEEAGEPEMTAVQGYGRRGISAQFRWPSFSQPPAFDKSTGFYVPREYNHNEDDPFLSVSLVAPGCQTSKSSRPKSVSRSTRKRSPRGDFSRRPSNSTSIGLLDLYESDEEEEERRRKETPWESLRHKSIKRGILDQVKKENTWINSLRSSFAEGSTLPSGREYKNLEEEPAGKDGDMSVEMPHMQSRRIEKRRGHVRADSDLFVDNAATSYQGAIPLSNVIGPSKSFASGTPHKQDGVVNSAIPEAHIPTPRGRRTFAKLKDEKSRDKYTPLPARQSQSRSPSRSRSRSRSAGPAKRTSIRADQKSRAQANVSPRNVLPRSPAQVMSPPLESQMCFTPIPPLASRLPSSKNTRSRPSSRTSTRTTPTKIPSATKGKGRKLCSSSPPPLPPLPVSSSIGEHLKSPRLESSRARLANKAKNAAAAAAAHNSASASFSHTTREKGSEDVMKKIDHIMETGWCERDLDQQAMRGLSPSGFGREV